MSKSPVCENWEDVDNFVSLFIFISDKMLQFKKLFLYTNSIT